jgi:hypothetical protein
LWAVGLLIPDLQHILDRRHDVVGIVHGHHDLRSAACEALYLAQHVLTHVAIETGARLIEQQQFGFVRHRARQQREPHLTVRDTPRAAIA